MKKNSTALATMFEQLHKCFYKQNTSMQKRTQGKLLKILSKKGPISQKEMQEKLQIQPGSMSEIVAKLEHKGLIMRKKDPEDNRRMMLSITDAGLLDVSEYAKNYEQNVIAVFDILSEEEQEQLFQILRRLSTAAKGDVH